MPPTSYVARNSGTSTGYIARNTNSLNVLSNNYKILSLIKNAQIELNIKKKLSTITLNSLINIATKWDSLYTILQDSKSNHWGFDWNFSMPKILTIPQIQSFKQSAFYRFVIDQSGLIIFGYENIFVNPSNRKYQNIFQNITPEGILIAPHAALNNYQCVIAAGKVFYNNNKRKFTEIDNQSGHYKPDEASLKIANILFQHHFGDLVSQILIKPQGSLKRKLSGSNESIKLKS
jgi:hypothetical protein